MCRVQIVDLTLILPPDVSAGDGEAEPALGAVLEVAAAHLQQLRGDLQRAHGLVHLLVRHGEEGFDFQSEAGKRGINLV